ncbi:MAG TPA: hypothetical protein VMW52_12575 [Phycisphaerae bacterium]|nr:hypothetical protein [Phycisphaerae bacterium]
MQPSALQRQTREDRGLVLDMLNSVYPASLPERAILDSMLDLPRPVHGHNVRRDLGYLEDSQLIARTFDTNPFTKAKEVRWSLTSRGVSFVEAGKPWERIEQF